MTRSELLSALKKVAFLEGDFTTRAGKKTSYYIDKYRFETTPTVLEPLAQHLAQLLPDPSTYDRLAGPELGAVPLVALVSVLTKKPYVIVRKESKGYGTNNRLEGLHTPGERVVVLEDILTTGGAVLSACAALMDAHLKVVHIIGVVNREEGAFENIEAKGFTVSALFSTTDLKTCP